MLVSVDTGSKAAGVACFKNNQLHLAFLARGETWQETTQAITTTLADRMSTPTTLVLEKMQIYAPSKQKGRQKDLLTLTLMAGALIASIGFDVEHELVTPAAWKGQLPKEVLTERVKKCLSEKEHARVELSKALSLNHNLWDGVGIGLWHLGRKGQNHG